MPAYLLAYLPTYLPDTYLPSIFTHSRLDQLEMSSCAPARQRAWCLPGTSSAPSARAADLVGGQAATSTQLVQTPVKTLATKTPMVGGRLKVMRSDHQSQLCWL